MTVSDKNEIDYEYEFDRACKIARAYEHILSDAVKEARELKGTYVMRRRCIRGDCNARVWIYYSDGGIPLVSQGVSIGVAWNPLAEYQCGMRPNQFAEHGPDNSDIRH